MITRVRETNEQRRKTMMFASCVSKCYVTHALLLPFFLAAVPPIIPVACYRIPLGGTGFAPEYQGRHLGIGMRNTIKDS